VRWYSVDHRHSGIRYVSPAKRHAGDDHAILVARQALYAQARERIPERWSGDTRDWRPIGVVALNPERDILVDMEAPRRRNTAIGCTTAATTSLTRAAFNRTVMNE
jgi:hypothetical protein